jgi:hypothetical protein
VSASCARRIARLAVIASDAKQSIMERGCMDRFAALSMTLETRAANRSVSP